MTEREAFEQAGYSKEWELWQAACKYQGEKDAEICKNQAQQYDDIGYPFHKNGSKEWAISILNQVDEGVIEV